MHYHSGKLKSIFGTLIEKSEHLVTYLGKFADENKPVNTKDAIARFTTDVITNIAFGLDTDSFNEPNPLFRYNKASFLLA